LRTQDLGDPRESPKPLRRDFGRGRLDKESLNLSLGTVLSLSPESQTFERALYTAWFDMFFEENDHLDLIGGSYFGFKLFNTTGVQASGIS